MKKGYPVGWGDEGGVDSLLWSLMRLVLLRGSLLFGISGAASMRLDIMTYASGLSLIACTAEQVVMSRPTIRIIMLFGFRGCGKVVLIAFGREDFADIRVSSLVKYT